ncbi:hypothetical protein [Streptomyces asiaticus]
MARRAGLPPRALLRRRYLPDTEPPAGPWPAPATERQAESVPETPAPAPSEEEPGSTVGQFLAHRFRVLPGLRQVHPDDHVFHLGGDSLMDPGHWVIVAELDDRFGTYGTIGLAVLSTGPEWTIRLLLMSCRVMGRNVGTALIAAPARTAAAHGAHRRPLPAH